jgi:hypothetical protein
MRGFFIFFEWEALTPVAPPGFARALNAPMTDAKKLDNGGQMANFP